MLNIFTSEISYPDPDFTFLEVAFADTLTICPAGTDDMLMSGPVVPIQRKGQRWNQSSWFRNYPASWARLATFCHVCQYAPYVLNVTLGVARAEKDVRY